MMLRGKDDIRWCGAARVAVIGLSLMTRMGMGAEAYWTGDGGDGLWRTGKTWTSDSFPPGSTDEVFILEDADVVMDVGSFESPDVIKSLTLDGGAGTPTLTIAGGAGSPSPMMHGSAGPQ